MSHKNNGFLGPQGDITLSQSRNLGDLSARPRVKQPIFWRVRNFFQHGHRSMLQSAGMLGGLIRMEPQLSGAVYRPKWAELPIERAQRLRELLKLNIDVFELAPIFGGNVTDYGVLSRRAVTTAGVNFLCDAFQNLAVINNMRYHGFGTGTNAEAAGDTSLQTELTTQYNPDSTRPTGTQTEGASANIYRTVGTLSPDSGGTIAITEHGIFSATSSGTLWDRSVFSAVNLVAGSDSLQVTYDLTLTAGS